MPHAPRAFKRKMNLVMRDLGFKRLVTDQCVYIRNKTDTGARIIMAAYVDDAICITSDEGLRSKWEAGMAAAFHKVKFMPTVDGILNVGVREGADDEGMRFVELSQDRAILDVAAAVGVEDARAVATPMMPGKLLEYKGDPVAGPGWECASVLGAVMYIANVTRLNLLTAVSMLAKFSRNPGPDHYRAMAAGPVHVLHAEQVPDPALVT